ncbi:hypothetical protein LIER_08726 [Lithospermum erythrorhizon]|uniref:Retrotransposon Copia-like N-terminal domain-containing protein n=1 Tax=Lithospermum erythrorhizon TaxID=34254 RepID=A0AAV3PED9_LITER
MVSSQDKTQTSTQKSASDNPPAPQAIAQPPPPPNPVQSLTQVYHVISIKLTPTNYILWKSQLVPFLKGRGLLGYVTGATSPPPITSPNFAHWDRQDAAILSYLISSLSEEVAPDSVDKSTSKELWDALRDIY